MKQVQIVVTSPTAAHGCHLAYVCTQMGRNCVFSSVSAIAGMTRCGCRSMFARCLTLSIRHTFPNLGMHLAFERGTKNMSCHQLTRSFHVGADGQPDQSRKQNVTNIHIVLFRRARVGASCTSADVQCSIDSELCSPRIRICWLHCSVANAATDAETSFEHLRTTCNFFWPSNEEPVYNTCSPMCVNSHMHG